MLTLTSNATKVIRHVVGNSSLPDSGGIRIASANNGAEPVTIGPAAGPETGDKIVEEQGARVFLEPSAAGLLSDKMLDAGVNEEGAVTFIVSPQGAES